MRGVAGRLVQIQPAMAPFYHLANVLLRAPRGESVEDDIARVRAAPLAFVEEAEAYAEEAAEHAAALLPLERPVITYSRSSSVLEAFAAAAEGGRRHTVRLSEARPRNEGRGMARAVLDLGHLVEFFTDAALFAAVKDAGAVLVGADTVGETRFRNKVGTSALLRAARDAGVPCTLVTDPLKLLPERFWMPEGPRPAREVWPVRRTRLEVVNRYFEEVPLRLLDGVVLGTGEGDPHPPDELSRWPTADYFKPLERVLAGA